MRILLDENLDWRLRRHLPGHEVDTVAYIGWSGMTNGVLLRQAAAAESEAQAQNT
jgi:predicted nuclease of predicted toxin-antitoxin system